jgi:hypothetical protein
LTNVKGGSPGVRLVSMLAVGAALCAGAPAHADADPRAKAKAEALFSQAMELSERGQHRQACERLEEAVRLTERDALGGILELARCKEKLGQTASAWALYREVAAKAARSKQLDRERDASRAANDLEPRLHSLQLVLAPELTATPGLSIRQGSIELGPAAWTAPMPVDPGQVVIEARAPGKRSIVRKVQVPSQPGTTRVSLPPFEQGPAGTPPPAEHAGGSTEAHPPSGWSGARIAGAVVAGAGALTMATSGVLILIAKSEWNDAHAAECSADDTCSPEGKERIDAARDKGTLATIVFGAGAALTITGAVLFLAAPAGAPERASVGLNASPRGGGLTLRGRF